MMNAGWCDGFSSWLRNFRPGTCQCTGHLFLAHPYRRDAPYAGAVEAQDAVLRPPVHARVDGVPVARSSAMFQPKITGTEYTISMVNCVNRS